MKRFLNILFEGIDRIFIFLIWLMVALFVICMNLKVVLDNGLPDWLGIIFVIIFIYFFIRYSKLKTVILDLLAVVMIYVICAIRRNGLDGFQKMLHDFYTNTGSEIINGIVSIAMVIGIGYILWKSTWR